ncbi:phosphoribosylanthranilate isomerase, partial [bacterium]|nr:phosphoribosylanthranilate isomerase [bacterium]
MSTPRIKICCISSLDEARSAIRAGASALGLVSSMPSGPGVIPDERIAEIAAAVPPPIATFLLTSQQTSADIIQQQRILRTSTIQICDRIDKGSYQEVRKALPGIKLVQVVHVNGDDAIDEAVAAAAFVDAILLDSGNQNLAVKELGGTGRRHDWRISRTIRERLTIPMFLAGGL